MSGNLYQPYSKINHPVGTPILLNAHFDKYGYVYHKQEKVANNGLYVLLVRGTGHEKKSNIYQTITWGT